MLVLFDKYVSKHRLFDKDDLLLVAVSGGVDSTVLSDILHKLHFSFIIAHCNFQLRGSDSDGDEEFLYTLADKYGVDMYVKRFDTSGYAKQHNVSIEMAARTLRYGWFDDLHRRLHSSKIVVAHHLNDSLETILFNITKGTGMCGLAGIQRENGNIVRPLLFTTKQEIIDYARRNGLTWREDATNRENDHARNIIRNIAIPAMKMVNPNIEHTFRNTMNRIQQSMLFLKENIDNIKHDIFLETSTGVVINISSILDKPWFCTIMWEMLKPYGFTFVQVSSFSDIQISGKRILSKHYELLLHDGKWLLSRNDNNTPSHEIVRIDPHTSQLTFDDYTMRFFIHSPGHTIINDQHVHVFDFNKIKFPLKVRYWQHGDKFCPLGMRKYKKVCDFFKDIKVPVNERQTRALLLDADDNVMCVIGHRIDERCKITSSTEVLYECTISCAA